MHSVWSLPRNHWQAKLISPHSIKHVSNQITISTNVLNTHYDDVIMGAIASLITSLTIVYSTVYSDAGQRKHRSSASLAFVWVIHRGPVNSPHKWPVTQKMFPFDDVIMPCRIRQAYMYVRHHQISTIWLYHYQSCYHCSSPRYVSGLLMTKLHHMIHFRISHAKAHQDGRFWFDISYNSAKYCIYIISWGAYFRIFSFHPRFYWWTAYLNDSLSAMGSQLSVYGHYINNHL